MLKKLVITLLGGVLLTSCSSMYQEYYQDLTGGINVNQYKSDVSDEVKVLKGTDKVIDTLYLLENNYINIGQSLFYSHKVDIDGASMQAKEVNASLVLVYSDYVAKSLVAIDTTSNRTQYTGPDSWGNGYYSSDSILNYQYIINGSSSYINQALHSNRANVRPTMSRKIYDNYTTYWIKMKPPVFGSYIDIMPDEFKQKIGISNGVIAAIVINDSPAAKAGIQRGDVIQKIGDKTVVDDSSYRQATKLYAGKEVTVELFRKGEILTVPVQLGVRS